MQRQAGLPATRYSKHDCSRIFSNVKGRILDRSFATKQGVLNLEKKLKQVEGSEGSDIGLRGRPQKYREKATLITDLNR